MAATELALGIGCQRGASSEMLARGIDDALRSLGFDASRVRVLASSERKRDEVGLLALAQERGWALVFHADLGEGVAEPAAAKHGRLVLGKRVYEEAGVHMTIAIAELAR